MAETIKVTIQELLNATPALDWLGEQKLPLDRVLPLIRARRVAREHIGAFTEARNGIIKRYSNGGNQVPPECFAQASEEINFQVAQTVEVPDPGLTWEMVKGLFEKANLLEPLLWLIKDVPLE